METTNKKIEVPNIGMTLSRALMPQFNDPKPFLKHLKDKFNIKYTVKNLDTKDLKSTQSDFDDLKVKQMMFSGKPISPILVSTDGHILDGHHRWLAKHNTTGKTKAYVIDHPVLELRKKAQDFGNLSEELTHKEFGPMLDSFVSFASDKLGLKTKPKISFKKDDGKEEFTSFGGYRPDEHSIVVATKSRQPMDIFRTMAHELVHAKQNEDGRIKDVEKEGATGSPIEDEANAVAGRIMRWYAKANPSNFKLSSLVENKAIFVVGVPCSGKDSIVRDLKEQRFQELNIQTLHKTNITSNHIVISTIAHDYSSIEKAKNILDYNGYVTEMIFVDVSNEISKMRNEQRQTRGQRVINESVRFAKYNQSKENYDKFSELFEGRITKIMNDDLTEACWKGYYQPKKQKLKPKKGSPGQFVPNCVPNKSKIDEKFEEMMENKPSDREWKTESLTKIYKEATPGQTFPKDPLFEAKPKLKIVRKKKLEEDGFPSSLNQYNVQALGSSGIGPEYGNRYAGSIYGIGDGMSSSVPGLGPGGTYYPFGTSGMSESVAEWANDPKTIERFTKKYGDQAQQKLQEAVDSLNQTSNKIIRTSKSIKQLREAWDASSRDMGTVPAANRTKDEMYEDSPAWQRKEGKNPEGGLNKKGVASYRREHPGSKLSTAVTTDPSKLKKGSKKAKRRLSFCRRMKGMKKKLTSAKTARDPDSRINKSLRKWNCEE